MNKKLWDLYAPVYAHAMRPDKKVTYKRRISARIAMVYAECVCDGK